MARIPRKTQKIFASTATNNGVFGSAADGTKVLSTDLDVLQSKPAWLTGWLTAVIGTKKFPPLEEFQALNYINTTQQAYMFQEGIPEYDIGTTYFQNGIVKKAGTYQLYGSVTDNNVGNALTDVVNWVFLTDLSGVIGQATESVAGIAKIATAAQVATGTDDQTIITPLKAANRFVPTGAVLAYALSAAPAGYVLVSGKTIGNASSGGTNRANADCSDLFQGLWATYSNTLLPIQDSSGTATTRGVSAAADFAANKRLPCLDLRGRVIAGLDNMGGTPAGRLTGQPFGVNGTVAGSGGGQELHSLTGVENGPHVHASDPPGGYPPGFFGLPRSTTGTIAGSNFGYDFSSFLNTASSGNGDGHNNVQPTLVLPYIIKL